MQSREHEDQDNWSKFYWRQTDKNLSVSGNIEHGQHKAILSIDSTRQYWVWMHKAIIAHAQYWLVLSRLNIALRATAIQAQYSLSAGVHARYCVVLSRLNIKRYRHAVHTAILSLMDSSRLNIKRYDWHKLNDIHAWIYSIEHCQHKA